MNVDGNSMIIQSIRIYSEIKNSELVFIPEDTIPNPIPIPEIWRLLMIPAVVSQNPGIFHIIRHHMDSLKCDSDSKSDSSKSWKRIDSLRFRCQDSIQASKPMRQKLKVHVQFRVLSDSAFAYHSAKINVNIIVNNINFYTIIVNITQMVHLQAISTPFQ